MRWHRTRRVLKSGGAMNAHTKQMKFLIHDLCNSLGIISGQAEILCEYPNQRNEKNLNKLRLAAKKANKLIREARVMLADSESEEIIETNTKSEISEFENLLKELESVYDIDIEFKVLSSSSKEFHSCPIIQERILTNLIENSSKAGATKVVVSYFQPKNGNYKVLAVRDNGPGVPSDKIKDLGSGYTTNGTGFGTRFIKDIVSEVGGAVVFRNLKETKLATTGLQCTITMPIAFVGGKNE